VEQFVLQDSQVASFRTKIDTGVSNFTAMPVPHVAGWMLVLAFALGRLALRRSRGDRCRPPGIRICIGWRHGWFIAGSI